MPSIYLSEMASSTVSARVPSKSSPMRSHSRWAIEASLADPSIDRRLSEAVLRRQFRIALRD
jgi:hypothetical protein